MKWPELPEEHPTPSLVVHEQILHGNIHRMQAYCDQHRLRLRPHTKTHKSLFVAAAQIAAGAKGLTVAKAGEAEVMSHVSHDLFVAYPGVGVRRLGILASLARNIDLSVGLDSLDAAEQFQAAAKREGSQIGVLVDLDVGFFRTGIADADTAIALCEAITKQSHLRFRGLMCFPGNLLPDSDDSVWRHYADTLGGVLHRLKASGIPVELVSGGSTPTALQSHRNPFLNEIRPGTYAYNDWNEVRLGVATLDDCAARILTTVVSVPSPRKFVVDAGSKTLSSDRNCVDPDSGFGYVVEYPESKISRLSEEHGEITLPDSHLSPPPRVGDRVWIIPNHICVCVNLQNEFHLWDGKTTRTLPVDARGLLV